MVIVLRPLETRTTCFTMKFLPCLKMMSCPIYCWTLKGVRRIVCMVGYLSMYDIPISIFYLRFTCNTLASSSIFLDTAFASTSKIEGCCER